MRNALISLILLTFTGCLAIDPEDQLDQTIGHPDGGGVDGEVADAGKSDATDCSLPSTRCYPSDITDPLSSLLGEIEAIMPTEWDRLALEDLIARSNAIVHGTFADLEIGRTPSEDGVVRGMPMSLMRLDVIEVLRGEDLISPVTVFFEFQLDTADIARAQLAVISLNGEAIVFLIDSGIVEQTQEFRWIYEGASPPQDADMWRLTSPEGIIIDDTRSLGQVGGSNFGTATTIEQIMAICSMY